MAHCVVEAAEKILDKEYKVLDKGFVRLVDYLGSDERIVQAARVSYGKGTKTYREDSRSYQFPAGVTSTHLPLNRLFLRFT